MSDIPSQKEEFRRKLEAAEGVSRQVIIVFADIRDFSRFSRDNDATDVGIYISRIYLQLMGMFPSADFYKATGDGLMIIVPHDRGNLRDRAQEVVQACVKCVNDFSQLCVDDEMINFEVPNRIGFGITRGSASCIVSGDEIVDFSGHRLNLAARLTDLARPEGVVIDSQFSMDLLDPETAALFRRDTAFLPGLAEREPYEVHCLDEKVVLSDHVKRPIGVDQWDRVVRTFTARYYRSVTVDDRFDLPSRARSPESVLVKLVLPQGRVGEEWVEDSTYTIEFAASDEAVEYTESAGQPQVRLSHEAVRRALDRMAVPDDMDVKVEVLFVPL